MVRAFAVAVAFASALGISDGFYEGLGDVNQVSFLQTSSAVLPKYRGFSPRMASRREALEDDYQDDEAPLPIQVQAAEPDLSALETMAVPANAEADFGGSPFSADLADPLVPQDEPRLEAKKPLSSVEKVVALARESIAKATNLQDELSMTKRQLAVAGAQLKEAAHMEEQLDKAAKVASSRMEAAASQAKAAAERQSQAEDIAKAESTKALSLQQLASVEAKKAMLAEKRLEEAEGKALERATHAEDRSRALEEQLRKNEASAQRALAAMKAYQRREQQVELQAANEVRQSRLGMQRARAQVAQAQADAIRARASQAAAEEQAAQKAVMEAAQARNQIAEEVKAAEAQAPSIDNQPPTAPAAAPLDEVVEASQNLDAFSEDASPRPKD